MTERKAGALSRFVHFPLGWLGGRWNVARYGFSEGQLPRQRMDDLLADPVLSWQDVSSLLVLMRMTSSPLLQLKIADKMYRSVEQLCDAKGQTEKLPWSDS